MSLRKCRLKGNRLPEESHCFIVPPGPGAKYSEQVHGTRMLRLERLDLPTYLLGFLKTPGPMVPERQIESLLDRELWHASKYPVQAARSQDRASREALAQQSRERHRSHLIS